MKLFLESQGPAAAERLTVRILSNLNLQRNRCKPTRQLAHLGVDAGQLKRYSAAAEKRCQITCKMFISDSITTSGQGNDKQALPKARTRLVLAKIIHGMCRCQANIPGWYLRI